MSRSIDLFIRSSQPIEELAREVAQLTGLTLSPGEDAEAWVLDDGDIHAELHRHGYVDDGDLLFESYPFALSARVVEGTRPADSDEADFLRTAAEGLRRGGAESLLVHDLEYRDRPRRPDAAGSRETAGSAEAGGPRGAGDGGRPS